MSRIWCILFLFFVWLYGGKHADSLNLWGKKLLFLYSNKVARPGQKKIATEMLMSDLLAIANLLVCSLRACISHLVWSCKNAKVNNRWLVWLGVYWIRGYRFCNWSERGRPVACPRHRPTKVSYRFCCAMCSNCIALAALPLNIDLSLRSQAPCTAVHHHISPASSGDSSQHLRWTTCRGMHCMGCRSKIGQRRRHTTVSRLLLLSDSIYTLFVFCLFFLQCERYYVLLHRRQRRWAVALWCACFANKFSFSVIILISLGFICVLLS